MKRSKYNNKKVIYNNIKFDSIKEKNRYIVLKNYLKCGIIKDLKLQPEYILQESFKDKTGKTHRKISYFADFEYTYVDNNKTVVEDVKGVKTVVFKLKMKLLLSKYPDINFILT